MLKLKNCFKLAYSGSSVLCRLVAIYVLCGEKKIERKGKKKPTKGKKKKLQWYSAFHTGESVIC